MSIQNILQPNILDLYCKSLTTNDLIISDLQVNTLELDKLYTNEINASDTNNIQLNNTILPNGTIDLGNSTDKFNNIYSNNITIDNLNFNNLTVDQLNTNIIAINDTTNIQLNNSILPNGSINWGDSSNKFNNIYSNNLSSSTLNTDSLNSYTSNANIILNTDIVPNSNTVINLGTNSLSFDTIYTSKLANGDNIPPIESILLKSPIKFDVVSPSNQSDLNYFSLKNYTGFTSGAFVSSFSYVVQRVGNFINLSFNIDPAFIVNNDPIFIQMSPSHSFLYPDQTYTFIYLVSDGSTPNISQPSVIPNTALGEIDPTGLISLYSNLRNNSVFSSLNAPAGPYPFSNFFTITYYTII
mgnify:CR=1 FL=1